MIKIINKVHNSQQPKQRQRLKIEQQVKLNLINSVVNDHLPVYQAAKLHKLKYSSAKHIFRNYQRDTNNLFQKKRKQKLMLQCQNVIIDIASGEIKLFDQNNTLQTNFQEKNINPLNNQIISIISKLIYQEINNVKNHQSNKSKHNLDEQLVHIKKVLINQYQMMLINQY